MRSIDPAPRSSTIPADYTPVTSVSDHRSHDVDDHAYVAGSDAGRYMARCGREVIAAALEDGSTATCPDCLQRRPRRTG